MQKSLIFLFLLLLKFCSFLLPIFLNKESFFVIEEEMIGTFVGRKFFFNRYNELTGTTTTERICNLTKDRYIKCNEIYQYQNKKIVKEFCFYYQYNSSYDLLIQYWNNCKKQEDFFLSLFYSFNKLRGAGFNIISYDSEPLNNKRFPISYYFIRGIKNQYYFEEKHYFLFFWQIGKELTIWEKK